MPLYDAHFCLHKSPDVIKDTMLSSKNQLMTGGENLLRNVLMKKKKKKKTKRERKKKKMRRLKKKMTFWKT
jgi:hypothetical protein